MKYKLAIFDFDGTLVDSYPFFLGVQNELAKKYNFKQLTMDELDASNGDPMKMMKEAGMSLWKLPLVMRGARKMMADRIDQIPLFGGVNNMLQALSKNGVALSMITSNSYANVSKKLGTDNMTLLRDPQFDTSLFGKGSRLKKLIRRTMVEPKDTIYIGDEIRDIKSARAQHIPFGAVSWGYTRIETLIEHSPTEVFKSMDEIVETIVG